MSKNVGRIIMVDVDGVVADFIPHLLDSIGSEKTKEDITNYDLTVSLSPDEWGKARDVMSDLDWWDSIPPIEESKRGLEDMRHQGAAIIWVSQSPESFNAQKKQEWINHRIEWLLNHELAMYEDEFLLNIPRHHIVCDVMIDDCLAHLIDKGPFSCWNPYRICFAQPWNWLEKDTDDERIHLNYVGYVRRPNGWRSLIRGLCFKKKWEKEWDG